MPEKERERYEHDLHGYWTYLSTLKKAKKDGIARGRAEGITRGRAEGKAERNIEIARNMKKEGLDPALIAKMTSLSQKEIKRLK